MQHLGDITKLNGAEIPAVDVITGGSPCQDLSVAGKRAGLAGERSGLFMEQIRIIKEMRECDRNFGRADELVRPRYMVWENVPGAFSSAKGKDFAAVLEETVRVAEPQAPDIQAPDKGWPTYGQYRDVDGRWSVAWRTLDAQYWGVPQRRRRIALVADFGGDSAGEILFERKSLSGDITQSGTQGKEAAGDAGEGACGADGFGETGVGYWQKGIQTIRAEGENRPSRPSNVICLNPQDPQSARVYDPDGTYHTLYASERGGQQRDGVLVFHLTQDPIASDKHTPCLSQGNSKSGQAVVGVCSVHQNASGEVRTGENAYTLGTNSNASGRNAPMIYDARGNGNGSTAPTLTGDHQNRVTDYTAVCMGFKSFGQYSPTDTGKTLLKSDDITTGDLICAATVRRLTPAECARLQGYPSDWCDIPDAKVNGKAIKATDSAKYKAYGNSIALPQWYFVLGGIAKHLPPDATLGSLFDGIGGFPKVWSDLHGGDKSLCVWASEIEPFPIAVTTYHFPEKTLPRPLERRKRNEI